MMAVKKVSIRDVANACRVSTATVSRAWNNSQAISEKTRSHILMVSESLGYIPNSVARSLSLNRTHMIGLVVLDITNPYYAHVSKGITSYLDNCGYGVILCNDDRSEEKEKFYLDFLCQKRVDGIIAVPIADSATPYQAYVAKGMQFVFIDNYVNDLDVGYVGNDSYSGGRKIALHLIKHGHRRIGVILSGKNSWSSNQRLKGYMDVLAENGIPFDESIICHTDSRYADGYRCAGVLIEKNVRAIFAINDSVALGAYKYCLENGIRIPEDIALTGFGDLEEASILPVPLTTVNQSTFLIGYKAAELLINQINNPSEPKQKIIMQPELIIRKTCGE